MATLSRCLRKSFSYKIKLNLRNYPFRRIIPTSYISTANILSAIKGLEIKMPSLSPTMTEGTIVKWLKQEGDTFSPGDVLCEIQTDKAIVGFEIDEEGILAKILVPNDTKDVKIGTVIGLMVESDQDWKDVEVSDSSGSTAPQAESSSGASTGIEIKMPSLSPTMTEGTIVKWHLKEGDSFKPGDALCDIQTDKAIVAFEVEEEGILAKILVPENTKDVKLGTVIAIMVEEGEDWQNVSVKPKSAAPPKDIPLKDTSPKSEKLVPSSKDEILKLCGPSVRNLLQNYGIEYSVVPPSGPHKNLLKGDVLNYINSKNLKPKPYGEEKAPSIPDVTFIEPPEYVDIPHTSMRQVIAKRLTESKTTIPHVYMSIDCNSAEVTKLREHLKSSGIKVSVNDFIIKCAAETLAKIPELNVICVDGSAKYLDSIDISIAVATEKGLITPIIKKANTLGVQEISDSVKTLAGKAREGRLKPDEYQGGSFSISNLGMFGISEFCAVINPPQGAILAIGTSRSLLDKNNDLVTMMTVTLSFDIRVIEETSAAEFLSHFKNCLENPLMFLSGVSSKKSSNL